jgi:hypothetical protein
MEHHFEALRRFEIFNTKEATLRNLEEADSWVNDGLTFLTLLLLI